MRIRKLFPPSSLSSVPDLDGLNLLPFEFVALEACLEAACSSLHNELRTLEQEAHPALDKLTSKRFNSGRVQQFKRFPSLSLDVP
ncbi:unnamed protein product [Ilex paraguariensis]|uniref:Uncharacterized protein n=1 Tax=Ilex paraguariensis TaxID=185542 RepID=A0ABC8TFY2_9AQUA